MFSVVFVDDDPAILRGFPFLIDWQEYGYEIVKTFSSPVQALEWCRENQPDMVISDIRMPEISGLELASALVPVLPNTVFVILTAYGEFEYAKAAMKCGVVHYLLKPVDEEELIHVLLSSKEKLLAAQQPAVRPSPDPNIQALLYALLTGRNVEQQLSNEQDLFYCLCLQEHTDTIQHMDTICDNAYWLPLAEFDAVLLLDRDRQTLQRRSKELFLPLGQQAQYAMIAPMMKGLSTLPAVYRKTANFYHACRFFVFCSDVVYPPAEWYSIGITPGFFFSQIAASITAIESGFLNYDYDAITQGLLGLEGNILNLPTPPDIPVLRDGFLQMLKRLRTHLRLHCHLGSAEEARFDLAEQNILQTRSYEAVKTTLLRLYEEIWDACDSSCLSTANRIVGYAKFYIRQNYRKDFRVTDIANACHVHPNYLSSLFKKELGLNVWAYVQQLRLEHACRLLQNTDLRISQIAEEVGFRNLNTFYSAFKKQYGQSPNDIRAKLQQTEEPDKNTFVSSLHQSQ